ncbi:hypothetical protein HDU92_005227 [Lobulomyces angularis]|nr:hypothetical protein HDU92_005227 [Lobulomyces angularis]
MMISFPNIWCLNETFNNVEEVKNWEDYFFKGKGRHTDFIRKIGLNKENEKFKELIWNEYSIAHCAKIPKHFQMKEQKFLMRLDVLSLELEKRVLDYCKKYFLKHINLQVLFFY